MWIRWQKKIEATFYPYRSLRHTIEWNHKYIHFKISQYLSNAPENILQHLAIILLAKVYKLKPDKSVKDAYGVSCSCILGEEHPSDIFVVGCCCSCHSK